MPSSPNDLVECWDLLDPPTTPSKSLPWAFPRGKLSYVSGENQDTFIRELIETSLNQGRKVRWVGRNHLNLQVQKGLGLVDRSSLESILDTVIQSTRFYDFVFLNLDVSRLQNATDAPGENGKYVTRWVRDFESKADDLAAVVFMGKYPKAALYNASYGLEASPDRVLIQKSLYAESLSCPYCWSQASTTWERVSFPYGEQGVELSAHLCTHTCTECGESFLTSESGDIKAEAVQEYEATHV